MQFGINSSHSLLLLVPSCLLPFCLHLLNIKLCHFGYSAKIVFLTLRQTSKQLNLLFLQQGVKGCFFHFAQALNQRISTLRLLLFISYTRQLHQFLWLFDLYKYPEAAKVAVDEFCNISISSFFWYSCRQCTRLILYTGN